MPLALLVPFTGLWSEPAQAAPGARLFESSDIPLPARYDGEFVAPPVAHWRVRLPGGRLNSGSHTERGRPTVRGEYVFVGSAAGNALYQLSRRDGSVVATFDAGQSVEAAPVFHDNLLYFADTGGSTWCYELDGTLRWTHDSRSPILVEPTVYEDLVLITNVDDLAVGLDAQTGDLVWRYQARKDLTRESELRLYGAPPAVVTEDELALLGFSDGTLAALKATTGEEVWKRRIGEGTYPDLVAQPITLGNDVFSSAYFQPLVALDLSTRNIRWRLDVGAASGPLLDEEAGRVYHPGSDGTLRSVGVLTGSEQWSWDSGTSGALTTPVLTAAGLILGSSEGGVYLIDPKSGIEQWRYLEDQMLQGVTASPTVEGRQLLFVSNAGYINSMLSPPVPGPTTALKPFPWQ